MPWQFSLEFIGSHIFAPSIVHIMAVACLLFAHCVSIFLKNCTRSLYFTAVRYNESAHGIFVR